MEKTALVTGAGRGIGRAIAEMLLAEGYMTVAVARTEKDLRTLQNFGNVFPFVGDISQQSDRERLVEFCRKNEITPHVLVNNAGIYHLDNVIDVNSELRPNLEMNLIQSRELTAALWSSMKSENAHVFNIVSVLGKQIRLEAASYTISKHAFAAYNKLLFAEGKKVGVKVTGIFPASVYTSSWEGSGVDAAQLISPKDISLLVKTCLALSAAAVPDEIHLQCMTEGF